MIVLNKINILNIPYTSSFLSILFFTSFFCCLSIAFYLKKMNHQKRLYVIVSLFFCLIGEYIFLDLLHLVNLTSSCSLIHKTNMWPRLE